MRQEPEHVAVIAHGAPRVPMLLRRRVVRVVVRAEEPDAVAAQDLSPLEVVVQRGFSFGGVSAAGRGHLDDAAAAKASASQTSRRVARIVDRVGKKLGGWQGADAALGTAHARHAPVTQSHWTVTVETFRRRWPTLQGERLSIRFSWRPQGDSNPRTRDENPVSWASRRWGLVLIPLLGTNGPRSLAEEPGSRNTNPPGHLPPTPAPPVPPPPTSLQQRNPR